MGNFGRYITQRLLSGIFTMWVIISLAFLLVRLAPGDPAEIWLADYATPELIADYRSRMGLDRPLWEQYGIFMGQVLTGDLGNSLRTGRPVAAEILNQYPYTLQLTAAALAVAVTFGLITGMSAALRHNTRLDLMMVLGSVVWISVPSFWLGLLLIFSFSVHFGWFPVTGAGQQGNPLSLAHHLVLPAVALGIRQAAVITRMSRSAMLDVMRTDYVRTARAKGLAERVVVARHALRNSLIPVLSVTGVETIILLGGSVVIENVFSRPGVGRLLVTAVSQRDYTMVQGCVFFFAAAVIIINLLTDVAYGIVDPRVRAD